jgi:hypothetical protein
MPLFVRVVATTLFFAVIMAAAFLAAFSFLRPSSSYAVVDETTLVVHDGQVSVQRADGSAAAATSDVTLHVNDRVSTGPDGYASITHVDGSTTAIDPNTELTLQRLDLAPNGMGNIALHVQRGSVWNRMERLVDSSTRFEVTTDAASMVARGTAFSVEVEPTNRTVVESGLDRVEVEAVGSMTTVDSGMRSTVDPGQPPSEPRPTPTPHYLLRVEVQGPVRPFITDSHHRSAGFHPEADVFISQIPGATYTVANPANDLRRLDVPDPVESYHVVLKGLGEGGTYTVTAFPLVDGRSTVDESRGLARASGTITGGALQGIDLQVRGADVRFRGTLENQTGATAGSRIAVVQRQLRTSARAVETAAVQAVPTMTASSTPSPTTPATPPTSTTTSGPTADPRTPSAVPQPTAVVPAATAVPATAAVAPTAALTARPAEATSAPTVVTAPPTSEPVQATAVAPPVTAPVVTAAPATAVPATEPPAPTVAPATLAPTVAAPPTSAPPTAALVTAQPPTAAPAAPRPTAALPVQLQASPTSAPPTIPPPPLSGSTPIPLVGAPSPVREP